MNKVRILIVDDQAILRSSLRLMLDLHGEFQVVGEAGDGTEALRQVEKLDPDVVLMDLAMPGMDGLTAIRRIGENHPRTKVLVLTQHADRAYLFPGLQAGASGYVLKSAGVEELISALNCVCQGKVFLDPSIAGAVVEDHCLRAKGQALDPYDTLSVREKEVLRLSSSGYTSREIADRLVLSPKTVDSYRDRLMAKLGLSSRSEMVQYALRKGLLPPPD